MGEWHHFWNQRNSLDPPVICLTSRTNIKYLEIPRLNIDTKLFRSKKTSNFPKYRRGISHWNWLILTVKATWLPFLTQPPKIGQPQEERSSSNHGFSMIFRGELLISRRVTMKPAKTTSKQNGRSSFHQYLDKLQQSFVGLNSHENYHGLWNFQPSISPPGNRGEFCDFWSPKFWDEWGRGSLDSRCSRAWFSS